MPRPSWDKYFLEIASVVAKRSTCPRLRVGAVITQRNKIITTGYNGASSGEAHCTEVGCHIVDNHCKRTIHAETNALNQLCHSNSNMVIYVTHNPCTLCRVLIARHGIKDIVWEHEYIGVTES